MLTSKLPPDLANIVIEYFVDYPHLTNVLSKTYLGGNELLLWCPHFYMKMAEVIYERIKEDVKILLGEDENLNDFYENARKGTHLLGREDEIYMSFLNELMTSIHKRIQLVLCNKDDSGMVSCYSMLRPIMKDLFTAYVRDRDIVLYISS